jgi:hypothetical protein
VSCVLAFFACLVLTSSFDTSTVAVAGVGSECVGDADGNGVTDIADFFAVLAAFGNDCSQEPCDEDLDDSGVVDIHDFITVIVDFGCGQVGCESDADCDDGNECTYDICIHGICLNIPICP